MKKCKLCNREKPIEEFGKDSQKVDKKRNYCKPCDQARCKNWKNNNKERVAEYNAHYKREYTYGLSKAEYISLLNEQDNKCAICNIDQKELSRKLVVDHCHNSNKVRGLLCSHCNVGIGMLKENEENLMAAIQYLKAHANG